MRRYGVFSITGYGIPAEGERNASTPRRWGTNAGRHDASTTWYVTDDAFCGEVIFETPYEHIARKQALDLNARERRFEKEEERAVLVASNGRP